MDVGDVKGAHNCIRKLKKNIEEYRCSICEYKSSRKSYLRKHLKVHCEEKTNECPVCEYKTRSKYNIERHMRVHATVKSQIVKKFACSQCQFRTVQRSKLNQHVESVHPEEGRLTCSLCGYRATRTSALGTHMRAHIKEKDFCCNLCSYRAPQESELRRHMGAHTRERMHKAKTVVTRWEFGRIDLKSP